MLDRLLRDLASASDQKVARKYQNVSRCFRWENGEALTDEQGKRSSSVMQRNPLGSIGRVRHRIMAAS
jgi:hypothetical protein